MLTVQKAQAGHWVGRVVTAAGLTAGEGYASTAEVAQEMACRDAFGGSPTARAAALGSARTSGLPRLWAWAERMGSFAPSAGQVWTFPKGGGEGGSQPRVVTLVGPSGGGWNATDADGEPAWVHESSFRFATIGGGL